jgi:hypothetical protein
MADNILIGGQWFPYHPEEGGKSDLIKEVARCDKRRQLLQSALWKLVDNENSFQKLQLQYMHSGAVWLSAIVEAAKLLDFENRPTISTCRELAKKAKKIGPFLEPVKVRLKSKGVGKYRHYCEFGPVLRGAQLILVDLLKPNHKPQPWQFGVAGRGAHHAIDLTRKLHKAGYIFASVLDIRSFYDGFHHSGIAPWAVLPVPLDLKIKAGIGKYLNLEKGEIKHQTNTQSEHYNSAIVSMKTAGLLPGSAFSGMAAAHILSKISPTWLTTAEIINYADDFLVLAQSETELCHAVFALRASIEAIPAGKFELLEKSGNSLPAPIVYLGHRLRTDIQGNLRVEVTDKSVDRFANSFYQDCEYLEKLAKTFSKNPAGETLLEQRTIKLAKRISSWAESFSSADDVEQHSQYFENVFCSLIEGFGINADIMLENAKKGFYGGWDAYGG